MPLAIHRSETHVVFSQQARSALCLVFKGTKVNSNGTPVNSHGNHATASIDFITKQAGRQAGRQAMSTPSSEHAVHYVWYFNDMPVNSNGNLATTTIDFINKQAVMRWPTCPRRLCFSQACSQWLHVATNPATGASSLFFPSLQSMAGFDNECSDGTPCTMLCFSRLDQSLLLFTDQKRISTLCSEHAVHYV